MATRDIFTFAGNAFGYFYVQVFFEAGLIESNGVPMTRRYGLGPLPFRAEHLKKEWRLYAKFMVFAL